MKKICLAVMMCAACVCAHAQTLIYDTPQSRGVAPALVATVDSIINIGLETGAFPGCQVLMAKDGAVILDKNYGTLTAGGEAVTDNTIYDLASVSKAIGTLPGVMKAYDMGLIELDAPVVKYLPQFAQDPAKADITVRQLLFHESGMQAALNVGRVVFDADGKLRGDMLSDKASEQYSMPIADNLWAKPAMRDTILDRICTTPLRKNKDYNYSCLNFCLLQRIVEAVTGKPYQQFYAESFAVPMGLTTIGYNPTANKPDLAVAPTETDSIFRHQTVQGYVHDETAAFSGGVSGNAGLFSNAKDIAAICQMWLNEGKYNGQQILSPETVRLFTTTVSPTCRRGLGFDKPDCENPDNSPTCEEARCEVYGHLGFTGTVFWVDPVDNLIFVFLNNRVNPSRINKAFSQLNARPKLFKALYDNILPAK